MSDQFDKFFDLQRFDTGTTSYSDIGASTAAKQENKYYWGAGGSLIVLDGTGNHSTSAIVQVNYSQSSTTQGDPIVNYNSVSSVADWVSLAGGGASAYKFTSISSTEDFNIIGLGDNTVEGLNFVNGDASVPALSFSNASDSSTNYIEIYNGALS